MPHPGGVPQLSPHDPMYAGVMDYVRARHATPRDRAALVVLSGPSPFLRAATEDEAGTRVRPVPPQPSAPSVDDLEEASRARVLRETRGRAKREALTPLRMPASLGPAAFVPVPLVPARANVCMLRVPDATTALGAAAYGAALLGHSVAAAAGDRSGGPHARLERVLLDLLCSGTPLLVTMGMARHDVKHGFVHYHVMHKLLAAGSLLLLVDGGDAVLALARPMGELVYVPPGETGFLHADLRGHDDARTCLELWVQLLAVAPHAEFSCDAWFKGPAADPSYRWDLNAAPPPPGCRDLRGEKTARYLPRPWPVSPLFDGTTLEYLAYALGDFRAKLAALAGVPGVDDVAAERLSGKAGRKSTGDKAAAMRAMVDSPEMYVHWRRAVLVANLLARGWPRGHAAAELACVLPACMLPPAPVRHVPRAPRQVPPLKAVLPLALLSVPRATCDVLVAPVLAACDLAP